MYGYIYLTTNLVNGKKYVGRHKSEVLDESYKGSGKILWRAIEKYGWDNFKTEIIRTCETAEELNQAEIEEIKSREAVTSEEYYNITAGGYWGAPWDSPEFRQVMTETMSGENNPAKRPEVREKMRGPRDSMKGEKNPNYQGRSVTEYQRQRTSEHHREAYKGEGNPMWERRGEDSPHYGKIHVNDGIHFITIPGEEF